MKKDLISEEQASLLDSQIASLRRRLFATVVCAGLASVAVTLFGGIIGEEALTSDTLSLATAGAAFLLSMQVVFRQKLRGLFPRLYASLGLALGLWFAAESIWTYYELAARIDSPFPSLADAFWLAGYAPFFYFLLGINKNFVGLKRSMTLPLLAVSSVAFVLLGNILLSIYDEADLGSNQGVLAYVVGSSYPVVDMFLVVPAVAAFIQVRSGKLTFAPWALVAASTIVFVIADIGFAYSTSVAELAGTDWIWNPLYNFAYVAIASALYWHRSFFTIDEKRLERAWQEKNR